jgi:hypothetical protein
MKKFIFHILCVCLLASIAVAALMYAIDSMGMTNYAYKRFTSEKQTSLIIGTSRAAQGIHPKVINNYFTKNEFDLPIYNFSFTLFDSPFGEVYLNAIKKKVLQTNKKSLFIIAIDPWSLSLIDSELDGNKPIREYKSCLNLTHVINEKPNFEYLLRYFRPATDPTWLSILVRSKKGHLNDDGWYEVNYKMEPAVVLKNIETKMELYYTYKAVKSEGRVNGLKMTIEYLKNFGSVYLCRMPVCEQMFLLEDKVWTGFDDDISKIANEYSVPYFSFRNDYKRFKTTDGNHLYKDDGAIFTQDLCNLIQRHLVDKRTHN